jgi:hypothetical protein
MFFPQDIKEQEDPEEVGLSLDVYDNWGSKWFEATFEIDAEDGSLTISGDSAWSPVLPFFVKLAVEYKLELEGCYDECGMDFAGMFIITKQGRLTDRQITSRQFRMQDNPEGFWEDVMEWISDGNFETIDDVKDTFDVDYWGKLTEEDVVLLQDALDKFHASEKEK